MDLKEKKQNTLVTFLKLLLKKSKYNFFIKKKKKKIKYLYYNLYKIL